MKLYSGLYAASPLVEQNQGGDVFPLFVKSVGKFFELAPARAAIEKFVQPRVGGALATMNKAEWFKTVSDYLKDNAASVVTIIASVSTAVDVAEIVSANAKTSEEKDEVEQIKRLTNSGSSSAVQSSKRGSVTDPMMFAEEANMRREKLQELGALEGLPVNALIRKLQLTAEVLQEFNIYKAMASIK